jgi:signal peptidase II
MKRVWGFVVAGLLVLLDQATKVAVKGFSVFGIEHTGMHIGESIPLVGDIVRITYIENPGMAFGIEFGSAKILLSLFSIAAAVVIGLLLDRLQQHGARPVVVLAFSLILAGAVGNLIDRVFYGVFYGEAPLFYGRVVDFIDVDVPDIQLGSILLERWWVFNIADAAVTCGMVLLVLYGHHMPPLSSLLARTSGRPTPTSSNDISQ